MPDAPFQPVATAAIERIKAHADRLANATDPHAALAALFLLHCECKAVADSLPAAEEIQPTQGDNP